jgi:dynein heavy chain
LIVVLPVLPTYSLLAPPPPPPPRYEYSLQFYIRLFNQCIRAAEKSDDLDTRLSTLLVYCTETIYSNICRGLFEKHKLLFSVLLCVQILVQRKDVGMDEYGLLLRGAGTAVCEETSPDEIILPTGGWNFLFAAEEAVGGMPSQSPPVEVPEPVEGEEPPPPPPFKPSFPFKGIIAHVLENWDAWKEWATNTFLAEATGDAAKPAGIGSVRRSAAHAFESFLFFASIAFADPRPLQPSLHARTDPQLIVRSLLSLLSQSTLSFLRPQIPAPFNERLMPFQQLLLVKAMAPDRINFALQAFVASEMGSQKFVETSAAKMDEVYADTNSSTPTVFILSTGADPTGVLQAFAKKVGFFKKLDTVALGQGQGPVAERLITRAVSKGRWVCLQNCHLAQSWLPALEQIVMGLAQDDDERIVHEDFRLFLTSMPAAYVTSAESAAFP